MVDFAEPKSFEIGLLALRYLRWSGFATDSFTFRISINRKLTASRLGIISGLNRRTETYIWGGSGRLRSLTGKIMSRLSIQSRRKHPNRW
jgi:hypothetical protein